MHESGTTHAIQLLIYPGTVPKQPLMSDVGGIGGINGLNPSSLTGPQTAATALNALRHHAVSTIEISDTAQNIAKNLDALQAYASKITAMSASDATQKMIVTGTQYQKDQDILGVWAAGSGQTVGINGAKASQVGSLASYVSSVSVSDTSSNIAKYLDSLQTLASGGVLGEIVQAGNPGNLTITSAQLAADQSALDKIRNHGYTLAITHASVSDVLGLDSQPSPLSTNAKVRSIAIVDTTDAIDTNLDALQQVGLRIKSISQTDATTPLTVSGTQYKQDKLVLGKIITSDLLAVIDASAAQASAAVADHKVVTIDIQDTAKNIARNWATLQHLSDSLTSVQVSDQTNAIKLTSDQFAAAGTLLGKFTGSYKLQVTNVSAATALAVASSNNVDSIDVTDSSANLVSSMADLQTINGQNKLSSITLSSSMTPMSMDISLLQGDQLTATQGVLDKINGHNYRLGATGVATSDLASLAANKRVVSIAMSDSSSNLESALTALHQLGAKLTTIAQTDVGTALDLTQTQMTANATVLTKIMGGYTANLTQVTAAKAAADALNVHIASIAVSDTGRNILAHWSELRAIGSTLNSVNQSDGGALSLSADNYQQGVHDNLVVKIGAGTTFSVTGASLVQAQAVSSDQAVTQIDVAETGSVIADNMAALSTLVTGGKLHGITNQTPTVSLSLAASQLAGSQAVLDLIKGGSYTLALSGVGVADAKALLAGNHKIASAAVAGDAADIVSNLSDLSSLGAKLVSITQTDAPTETLDMTGDAFARNSTALAKMEGGFLAVLSDVTASKAASFAANVSVSSMTVSDTGANLASAWGAMEEAGGKLMEVTQSDSSTLQLGANDWINGQTLRGKFTVDPTVSLVGSSVSQAAGLASDTAVVGIQVVDSSGALSAALGALAAQANVTQLVVQDPTAALTMSATTYADSATATVLGLVKDGQYTVALSDVAAQDAAALASDTHVSSMDVADTSSEVSTNFSALAATTNLNSIALSDQNGTITLTAAQIFAGYDTLAKIDGSYQLAATDVAMIDLPGIQDVPQVSSISISDASSNVSANFSDVLALGGTLAQIHLSDGSPVLSLSQQDWAAGTDALAMIDGTYQVDVGATAAGDAQSVASDSTVRQVMVEDTANNIVGQWDALIGLYNSGAGKLTGLSVNDANPLILTADQQTAGAGMITALLPDESIQTAP
jgi:hypothetical protein